MARAAWLGVLARNLRSPGAACPVRPSTAPPTRGDPGDVAIVDRILAIAAAAEPGPERLARLGTPARAAFRAKVSGRAAGAQPGARAPQARLGARRILLLRRFAVPRFGLTIGALAAACAMAIGATGPGQALYPARLSLESTILVGFQSPGSSVGRLSWLERRLDEAESAARSGSEAALDSALNAYLEGVAELARTPADREQATEARIDAEIGRLRTLAASRDARSDGGEIARRALRAAEALRWREAGPRKPPGACREAPPAAHRAAR